MRIPDGSSIFTAEAINLALYLIDDCETYNKFVIFSDSLSVLKSLDHASSKIPNFKRYLKSVMILPHWHCWQLKCGPKAKDSLNLHPTNFLLPYSNFKPLINMYIVNKRQILWNNGVGNKRYEIKPVNGQSHDKMKLCLLVCVLVIQGSHTHIF